VSLELAEVFARYGEAYRQKYGSRMPGRQRQVMRAVEACRTARLGGKSPVVPNVTLCNIAITPAAIATVPNVRVKKGRNGSKPNKPVCCPCPIFS
jgi:hypothetical protein